LTKETPGAVAALRPRGTLMQTCGGSRARLAPER